MSLTEFIAGVESNRKTLTVFNPNEGVTETLREQFSDRNVIVQRVKTDVGPRNYVVLSDGPEFLVAVAVADVVEDGDDETTQGFHGDDYRPVLDHLDETMFTSYSRKRMLSASREIEDRAWRVGRGQLHAGFQTLEKYTDQSEVYDLLGGRDTLDVHVYAIPGGDVVDTEGVHVHLESNAEIERSWFVAYDGGGVEVSKCALVAEERDDGEFYGFWTYDGSTVDEIVTHLQSTYAVVESDGRL